MSRMFEIPALTLAFAVAASWALADIAPMHLPKPLPPDRTGSQRFDQASRRNSGNQSKAGYDRDVKNRPTGQRPVVPSPQRSTPAQKGQQEHYLARWYTQERTAAKALNWAKAKVAAYVKKIRIGTVSGLCTAVAKGSHAAAAVTERIRESARRLAFFWEGDGK